MELTFSHSYSCSGEFYFSSSSSSDRSNESDEDANNSLDEMIGAGYFYARPSYHSSSLRRGQAHRRSYHHHHRPGACYSSSDRERRLRRSLSADDCCSFSSSSFSSAERERERRQQRRRRADLSSRVGASKVSFAPCFGAESRQRRSLALGTKKKKRANKPKTTSPKNAKVTDEETQITKVESVVTFTECYTPHLVALLYTCPVFTLCNRLANMISTTCKSQTEVFARSLTTKLQHLDGNMNEQNNHEDQSWLERTQDDADVIKFFPYPGTTFPPRRCAQFDLLRAKYHSESDLSPAVLAKANQLKELLQCEEDEEGNDSDLFFDFDIGSPEDNEEEEDERAGSAEKRHLVINRGFEEDRRPRRMGSDESLDEYHDRSGFAKASAAFGSASSGLCSDMEGLQSGTHTGLSSLSPLECSPEEMFEGLSMEPEDWILKQQQRQQKLNNDSGSSASATPIAAQSPNALSSPLISPDSLLDDQNDAADKILVANDDEIETPTDEARELSESATTKDGVKAERDLNSSIESSGDAETISVFAGESKHKIANSKLNALIASLEKDREYARTSPTKETSPTGQRSPSKTSPPSSPSRRSTLGIPTSPTKRSYKSTLPTIAASPANFSFLANCNNDRQVSSNPSDRPMHRCDSTPVLTSTERALIESPKPVRKQNLIAASGSLKDSFESSRNEESSPSLSIDASEKPERLRRTSSLKSGKTPPGTPGRRKIVRFADVFGLDLADVKTFLDEVPRVPKSAYKDLTDAELSDMDSETSSETSSSTSFSSFKKPPSSSVSSRLPSNVLDPKAAVAAVLGQAVVSSVSTSLVPMFNQPGGFPNFFDILRERRVCLENAYMVNASSVKGTIRVQNVAFQKRVSLRYTTTEWSRCADLETEYMQGSCDGFSDKFTFNLCFPSLSVGQRLQFCLRFNTDADEFWDNNGGKNYVFQCLSISGAPANANSSSSYSSSSTSSSSSSSKPKEVSAPVPAQRNNRTSAYSTTVSHSPSAMSDDPWLRYL